MLTAIKVKGVKIFFIGFLFGAWAQILVIIEGYNTILGAVLALATLAMAIRFITRIPWKEVNEIFAILIFMGAICGISFSQILLYAFHAFYLLTHIS